MTETFILIKPDAVWRKLVGKILSRFERKGLDIVDMRMLELTERQAHTLYQKFAGKDFLPRIIEFMTGGPCIVAILACEHDEAIDVVRKLIGATGTDPPDVASIRGEFAESFSRNVIHASDSHEAVSREIRLFFPGYYD